MHFSEGMHVDRCSKSELYKMFHGLQTGSIDQLTLVGEHRAAGALLCLKNWSTEAFNTFTSCSSFVNRVSV